MTRSGKPSRPTSRLPIDSDILEYARNMRMDAGGAERRLWYLLRARRFDGLKFRRQHAVGRYILDYYCDECKLDLEIDGETHLDPDQSAYDRKREEDLNKRGIVTLRFWSNEVLSNTEGVLRKLWEVARIRRRKE